MQAVAIKEMASLDVIKGAIAARMDTATFVSWIAPLDFQIVDSVLVLGAQNQFAADVVNAGHAQTLRAVAAEYGLELNICVANAQRKVAPIKSSAIANDNNTQSYSPAPVVKNESVGAAFDSFVVCEENMFVVQACKKIAMGAVAFSPLFVHGAAGCGKTLLMECVRGASNGRVVMMTGGQFVAEFARSVKDHAVFAFKDYCRNCDTFILDDVQALGGKKATMTEFLQLVMDLRAAGKNVVLTANTMPSNLTGFDRHAQSLMASGLVADVANPNNHVKSVLLRRSGVSAEVAEELAGRIANDGHLISGVAKKIQAYSELMGTTVDMNVASRLLADTLEKSKTPMSMVRAMCEKLGVSYEAICGNGRSRNLTMARQMMMAVLKGATSLSLSEIGNYVGGRDHATVLYSIKQIEKQKQTDLVLSAQIAQMINECR